LGHYRFCAVAIVGVNKEVKKDLVAGASMSAVYAVGPRVRFDKGPDSRLLETSCKATDEWRLSRTQAMEVCLQGCWCGYRRWAWWIPEELSTAVDTSPMRLIELGAA